jgi:2-polyprenyl-6-methoxyphenol hydroxylase-like FAD-dependent oxidoreductase
MDERAGDCPVLIVGGGPIGLALALELAFQGVRSLLVEQQQRDSAELLAKAGTLNERTLEFCRRWGISKDVAAWGADKTYPFDTLYVTSLNGHFLGRDEVGRSEDRRHAFSPEVMRKCPQHIFDPMLEGAVARTGLAELRYGTRFERLSQDDEGVTAALATDRGAEDVRASFLVGCDGAASRVRRELGIPFEGPTLDYSVSAMLRIERLEDYHPLGKATRYIFVGAEGPWANLTSADYGSIWRFVVFGSKERMALDRLDFAALLKRAFGRDDIPYELLRVVPWRRSQCTARTYVSGRVVLAGDAAHTTSPTGGHGLNTGMGDVVGLGWMLAARLAGWGGPKLLTAYEIERRPVALRNGRTSSRNYRGWTGDGVDFARVEADGPAAEAARERAGREMSEKLYSSWISQGIRLGYRYEDSPIVIAERGPEPADPPDCYTPTSRPGHRAPHVWLAEGHSIIDLFGRGFVLLRLGGDAPDAPALAEAARRRGVPLAVHAIEAEEARRVYELPLVLVRPDGHVAWRSAAAPNAAEALEIIDRIRGAATDQQEGSRHG